MHARSTKPIRRSAAAVFAVAAALALVPASASAKPKADTQHEYVIYEMETIMIEGFGMNAP
jgi:hypothetical protein